MSCFGGKYIEILKGFRSFQSCPFVLIFVCALLPKKNELSCSSHFVSRSLVANFHLIVIISVVSWPVNLCLIGFLFSRRLRTYTKRKMAVLFVSSIVHCEIGGCRETFIPSSIFSTLTTHHRAVEHRCLVFLFYQGGRITLLTCKVLLHLFYFTDVFLSSSYLFDITPSCPMMEVPLFGFL